MNKIFLLLFLNFSYFLYSYNLELNFLEINSENIEKGEEIFSVEIKDFCQKFNKHCPISEIERFKFKYYDNDLIEIIFFENLKRNLIKTEKEYKKIQSKDITKFLKTLELNKIKELEKLKIIYPNPIFSSRKNLPVIVDSNFLSIYNKELEKYRHDNNRKNPGFVRVRDKINLNKGILYDVTYKNKNFIISPEIEYQNKKVNDFILFIKYFVEKIRKEEEGNRLLNLESHRGISQFFAEDLSERIKDLKEMEIDIRFNEENEIEILRKKYINSFSWNISKIFISKDKNVKIKKINWINNVNGIIFKDTEVKYNNFFTLSEKSIKNISEMKFVYNKKEAETTAVNSSIEEEFSLKIQEMVDDKTDESLDIIISKQNIIKNKNSENENPKILYFKDKEIKNPIIYEVSYRGYIFQIIGDETLYENQEIQNLIRFLKSLEVYM